jgi:double-strand break repair protein MRE11
MPSRIKRSQKSQEASSDSNSSSDEEDASVHSSPEKQKGKSKSKDKEKDMQEEDEENDPSKPYLEEVDENTLRILVSTDNHLGYAERDGVRGNDSFAALEEVLYLAKHYQVDLLLLAGDLFHDNKPSRHTLYKTLQLFRKYCLGSNPVQIQIVGGELEGGGIVNNMFQQGHVNYEDPDYSVDLPVFCIHGNHDDPTRDNTSGQSLSAIDLLDVANLVNYIGKQSQVNQVQVKPVLIQKGTTNLALYGMGSMRDGK